MTPICEECNDTGGHDGEPSCWACALGAAASYDGEWAHSSDAKRARMGTRDEWVARLVRDYGRIDNRPGFTPEKLFRVACALNATRAKQLREEEQRLRDAEDVWCGPSKASAALERLGHKDGAR